MRDPRGAKLAELIVRHSTALQPGEAVLIEACDVANGLGLDLVEAVQRVEKITGSLHVTPGQACTLADNGNRSRIHWDLVLIQTPEFGGGEVWFDDELVRKDGRFVVPDLAGLNPEHLRG